MEVAVLLLVYSSLDLNLGDAGSLPQPTLLKADLQQNLEYLVAKAPFSLPTIWSRRNQDSDEVGTLTHLMLHDAFCGASGMIARERITALSASSCKLICHQPFHGRWPPGAMPLAGMSGHHTRCKVCSFWSIITVVISRSVQGSWGSSDRPESKSPHCSSSSVDFFTRLIFSLKCSFPAFVFLLLRL